MTRTDAEMAEMDELALTSYKHVRVRNTVNRRKANRKLGKITAAERGGRVHLCVEVCPISKDQKRLH